MWFENSYRRHLLDMHVNDWGDGVFLSRFDPDAYLENLYMQLEYYGAEYGSDYCAEAIDEFTGIIDKFGYEFMSEGTGSPLTNYIKKWRAAYV